MARAATCLFVVTLALAGCAQVLGIEEARVEAGGADDAGSAGSGGSGAPVVQNRSNTCAEEPQPDCATCLRGECGGAEQACAGDPDCWLELDSYAYCLGSKCDGDGEACSFEIDPPVLQACVQSCGAECAGTKLVSECELLCACMAGVCPDEDVGDCLTACAAQPAEVTSCRRDHCKMAARSEGEDMSRHCRHASDALHVCFSHGELPVAERFVCTDGAESTWACNASSECCSEECVNGACK